ncbi:MAG: butyrate kinase [Actinobacteria bacterium]|nr:butyrate kinase [Actinomycetota bacterium]
MYQILAINPGNTSTKIGFFNDTELIFKDTVRHDADSLKGFNSFVEQLDFRFEAINSFIERNNIDLSEVDFFIGRGGILKPLKSGLYEVNDKMIDMLLKNPVVEHASNLGALIADDFAKKYKKKAYILDPVCVDELDDIARISGSPLFPRTTLFHALNQKRMARLASKDLGKKYSELNLIVAMLGSGVSVGIHSKGMIIDVTNAVVGEGPFSPERAGAIPIMPFIKHILDNGLDYRQANKLIYGQGGLVAYLGTNDMHTVIEKYNEGKDEKVRLIVEAMAYQIAKEIAVMAVPVNGEVDAIVLTGGLSYEKTLTDMVTRRIKFITEKVLVYPGEDELAAMAEGVIGGINGEIEILKFK